MEVLLASLPHNASLRRLDLSFNWAGPDAMRALVGAAGPRVAPRGDAPHACAVRTESFVEFRVIERIKAGDFSMLPGHDDEDGGAGGCGGVHVAATMPSSTAANMEQPNSGGSGSSRFGGDGLGEACEQHGPVVVMAADAAIAHVMLCAQADMLAKGTDCASSNHSCSRVYGSSTRSRSCSSGGAAGDGGSDALGNDDAGSDGGDDDAGLAAGDAADGALAVGCALQDGGGRMQSAADGAAHAAAAVGAGRSASTGMPGHPHGPPTCASLLPVPLARPRQARKVAGLGKELLGCEDLLDGTFRLQLPTSFSVPAAELPDSGSGTPGRQAPAAATANVSTPTRSWSTTDAVAAAPRVHTQTYRPGGMATEGGAHLYQEGVGAATAVGALPPRSFAASAEWDAPRRAGLAPNPLFASPSADSCRPAAYPEAPVSAGPPRSRCPEGRPDGECGPAPA
eukprot:352375-Chlamydomonas_euryale.AAC.2